MLKLSKLRRIIVLCLLNLAMIFFISIQTYGQINYSKNKKLISLIEKLESNKIHYDYDYFTTTSVSLLVREIIYNGDSSLMVCEIKDYYKEYFFENNFDSSKWRKLIFYSISNKKLEFFKPLFNLGFSVSDLFDLEKLSNKSKLNAININSKTYYKEKENLTKYLKNTIFVK